KASFDISPESKQIVYVKITDNAGNATIINSNGIVLDSQAPTISGVTNETKHYGDTTFKVTDTNLLKVTVDNNEVKLNEGAYTITADNAEHTIVATDSAGNTTSYKIDVYKIYTLIFKADGNEVAQKKVNHGNDLTDIPEIPAKTGYDQKAPVWNVTNFTNIQEDKTIDAVYTINSYIVTPITGDGFEIKPIDKTTVNHGDNFTFKVEVKSGYNTSEMVVKAGKEDLKANEDGTYTTVITENTEITVTGVTDTTKPTGEIALSENKWAEFLNTITFGLFFKETQTINVTAEDTNGSGVKTVEYLLSETAFETVESVTGQWNKLTLNENKASFDISPESKQIVYVKITDNAGNATIINSNGIVVYTDSTLISGKTEFNNDIQQDIIININLNGNTVNKIYNGSIELEKDVDYIVTDETIIIKKEYIEKMLKEDSLTITLSFNPMDENFQGEENVPATAEFIIVKHIHTWDEGVVTIPAKIHEEGLMTYTCTACEFTRTEIIEKVPVNERIIISENDNISIKGQFTNQAKITVEQIVGQESCNDILRLINTDVNEIINAYDVNITDGDYTGRLSISFKIGEKYNGKTITVYHQKKNNEIEILYGVCENGLVTINVDELSPFVLTVEKSTEIPDTRDNSQNPWMAMLFISCSITFVFAGVMKKRAISKR
ncbi:MAG: X2-like carbohydrate binding domain-containing protein, partial [Oscillospiraceae bacterium]